LLSGDQRQLAVHTIAKDFKTAHDPLAEFAYEDLPAIDIAI
jgi:hypothetical protein